MDRGFSSIESAQGGLYRGQKIEFGMENKAARYIFWLKDSGSIATFSPTLGKSDDSRLKRAVRGILYGCVCLDLYILIVPFQFIVDVITRTSPRHQSTTMADDSGAGAAAPAADTGAAMAPSHAPPADTSTVSP